MPHSAASSPWLSAFARYSAFHFQLFEAFRLFHAISFHCRSHTLSDFRWAAFTDATRFLLSADSCISIWAAISLSLPFRASWFSSSQLIRRLIRQLWYFAYSSFSPPPFHWWFRCWQMIDIFVSLRRLLAMFWCQSTPPFSIVFFSFHYFTFIIFAISDIAADFLSAFDYAISELGCQIFSYH